MQHSSDCGRHTFFWEDSHWLMNTATNRKDPSKLVCLPQSELFCILTAGQSELRRQQSEISKRHFKRKRLPSNKKQTKIEISFIRFYYLVSKLYSEKFSLLSEHSL
jgi:hypothetical protein